MNVATTLLVVKSTEFPPAVGTLTTARNETLPIFDLTVLDDARRAIGRNFCVFVKSIHSANGTKYVQAIHDIDPTAESIPCVFCESGSGMSKQGPDVLPARFECVRYQSTLYLDAPKPQQLIGDADARSRRAPDIRDAEWSRFCDYLDTLMRDDPGFQGELILQGIRDTVEQTHTVTDGQRQAVANIERTARMRVTIDRERWSSEAAHWRRWSERAK